MTRRVDLRLSPGTAKKLDRVAKARTTNDSRPDALRMLIEDEYDRLVATRGETEGGTPMTRRGA
jgi:hypothetical protein